MVWNLALEVKKTAWESAKIKINKYELYRQLTELKQEHDWLYCISSRALQGTIKRLHKAYESFFRGNGRLKSKTKTVLQSFDVVMEVRVEDGYIVIPKLTLIRCEGAKDVPGQIKSATISKTATGK